MIGLFLWSRWSGSRTQHNESQRKDNKVKDKQLLL